MKKKSRSTSDLKEFRDLLVERARLLRGDLDTLEDETVRKGADGAGDLSTVPGHPAELASDNTERDVSYGRIESQSHELKEIREALDRIREGTFGTCEECARRIPRARLKAIPYTRRCVNCQQRAEAG